MRTGTTALVGNPQKWPFLGRNILQNASLAPFVNRFVLYLPPIALKTSAPKIYWGGGVFSLAEEGRGGIRVEGKGRG